MSCVRTIRIIQYSPRNYSLLKLFTINYYLIATRRVALFFEKVKKIARPSVRSFVRSSVRYAFFVLLISQRYCFVFPGKVNFVQILEKNELVSKNAGFFFPCREKKKTAF